MLIILNIAYIEIIDKDIKCSYFFACRNFIAKKFKNVVNIYVDNIIKKR